MLRGAAATTIEQEPIEFVRGLGIGFDATVGLLANWARQHTNFVNDTNIVPDVGDITVTDALRDHVRRRAEANTYEPARNVFVCAGYQFPNVYGVALARKRFVEPTRLESSSSVIYHGPFAGVKTRIGG